MKNWKCPQCGSGNRAPERPRRNDVRRYCLPCSGRTGQLVERECPSLTAKREQGSALSKKRKQTKRQREQAADMQKYTANDVDVRDVVKRALRLPSVLAELKATHPYRIGKRGPKLPGIHIRRCKRHPASRVGVSWCFQYRLQVSVWPNRLQETIRGTLVHEVVHLALPRGEIHGPVFKATMAAALADWQKLYPDEPIDGQERWRDW